MSSFTEVLPLLALYPEIHYKFKYINFSRYYKKEPEILFDLPFRTEFGKDVPILLLIKDSDKFPVTIIKARILLYSEEKLLLEHEENFNLKLNEKWFKKIFKFNLNYQGMIKVKATLEYQIGLDLKYCINDNFKTQSPFLLSYINDKKVNQGTDKVGDLHYHSLYTDDHVEYGAPIKETIILAEANGLNFTAITDHSYDLDDKQETFLEKDPDFKKFYQMRAECLAINKDFFSTVIPGEEVTVKNSKVRNIHLLCLNHPHFFEGSGDDAENWFDLESENSIKDLAYKTKDFEDTLLVAPHPRVKTPILEYFLIRRGSWSKKDLLKQGVFHWQILNGEFDQGFYNGLKIWKEALLEGYRVFISAGNDAHGNFSIFRQIAVPMIKMDIATRQLFGRCRTVIPDMKISEKNNKITEIIKELKKGNNYITSGPALKLYLTDSEEPGKYDLEYGSLIMFSKYNKPKIILNPCSSPFYGHLSTISVFGGILNKNEFVLYDKKYLKYQLEDVIYLNPAEMFTEKKISYFRIEVKTYNQIMKRCEVIYTNPIWIDD